MARPMNRPLSPFMFPVWYRFQITSALSIVHRLTGIGLAVGSLLLAWWLISVAAGGEWFEATHAFLVSPIGMLLSPVQRHPSSRLGRRLRVRPEQRVSQRLRRPCHDGSADRAYLALRISRLGGCHAKIPDFSKHHCVA
jgi:hypothetical protein